MAILDSGTSYVLMPLDDRAALVKYFKDDFGLDFVQSTASSQILKATCTSEQFDNLPDMKIQINQYIYTLPKKSYVLQQFNVCYLLIMAKNFGSTTTYQFDPSTGKSTLVSSPGIWILGNNFLTNYYSIYDLENTRIGLVPSKDSTNGYIGIGSVPITQADVFNFLTYSFICIWIGCLIWKMCLQPYIEKRNNTQVLQQEQSQNQE